MQRFSQWQSMARGPISVLLGVVVASGVLAGAVGAQSADSDPLMGVWNLNVARSVWSPGPRAPADLVQVLWFAPIDDGFFRATFASTNAQGVPIYQIHVYKVDGQRRPVHGTFSLGRLLATGQETNVTRSGRRIDARTVEYTDFVDGVAVGPPPVLAVSPDGARLIHTIRGTNAQGVAFTTILLYDRVP